MRQFILSAAADGGEELLVMKAGKVVEQGPADSVFDDPQDPYPRELISASLGFAARGQATSR